MAGLYNTRPKPEFCPRCGRVRLAGWSEGIRTRVDPTTIAPELFITAILIGVRLYWLDPIGLAYLDRHRMKSAAARRYPVLPQHRCALLWPHDGTPLESPRTDDAPPY